MAATGDFDAPTQNATATLLAPTWVMTLLSTIFVAMRFFCRIRYHHVWWDDWLMVAATLLGWATVILWSIYASLGGTSYTPLSDDETAKLQFVGWVSKAFIIAAQPVGKMAIAAFIIRLQAPSTVRTVLVWVLAGIGSIWNLAQIILIFAQCQPVWKLWDPRADGTCLPPTAVVYNAIASCSYLAFLDLAFVAIPIHMIWQLQMPLKKKITVGFLLSTGVFAFAMSVVKITYLPIQLNRGADLIHLDILSFIWNSAEANVVIIAGCVPAIVPLWDLMRGREPRAEPTQRTSAQQPRHQQAREHVEGSRNWYRRYGFGFLTTTQGGQTVDGESVNRPATGHKFKKEDSSWDSSQWDMGTGRDTAVYSTEGGKQPAEGIYVRRSVDVASEYRNED